MLKKDGKPDFELIHKFLADSNVGIYYNDVKSMKDLRLVYRKGQIINVISKNDLFNIVIKGAKEEHSQRSLSKLYENTKYKEKGFIETLKRVQVHQFRDTKDKIHFFFENGVLIAERGEEEQFLPWSKFDLGDKCLWADGISSKRFNTKIADNWNTGDWYKFVRNTVGDKGVNPLMRAIGYMLHTYKDPSRAKVVVFADYGGLDDNGKANGGSGKSVVAYGAMKYCRKVSFMEGKGFDENNKFKFQTIDPEGSIAVIDDIESNFKYKKLYNAITNTFFIERKGLDPIELPFRKSPKFIITTNYGTVDDGTSDIRRREVIAFTDYYNNDRQPIHEFDKLFFDDWEDDDWSHFYGFMIACAKLYLEEGICSYGAEEINQKAMKAVKGVDLYEYVENSISRWYGKDNAVIVGQVCGDIKNSLGINKENGQISRSIADICGTLGYKVVRFAKRENGTLVRCFYVAKKDEKVQQGEVVEGDDVPF